ncbi:glycoside hydrolase family 3 protein [Gryllotalpicola reticulitermitis]|uniref:beta-glucosidase n=1 Tax=Gryllotalpicola reticulitermitis TaxID=1184153 RepID=A0ABV8Q202_9MICO
MSIEDTTATYPYQDSTLPIEQRVDDLLSRMELADKVGLLFHTMAVFGDPATADDGFGIPSLQSMVRKRRMNHFNVLGTPGTAREFAAWQNAAQRIALAQPLAVPITFSTDPRHAFTDNPATAMLAGPFSQWPETLGLAAIGSAELVERFADVVRDEYTAVGLRVALHPQIDLATEPRWARTSGTFGEDAGLTSTLVTAYIRGLQGDAVGADSVAAMTKHFPGGGPQKDGEDPHFAYGREQIYPGGRFDYHLEPFRAAIAAGTSQMMPYYGMPVGTEFDEVAFGFNRSVITGLLREQLGFEGIVCTDWGLLTDAVILGTPMPARAWGVEHLSRPERMALALDAGVDQFGGELCTDVLLELVTAGTVSEARIDVSARRLLTEKFRLGLFENPFVDEQRADAVVGKPEHRDAGLDAQSASLTVLTNTVTGGAPTLPLSTGVRVYAEGVADDVLREFAVPVARPDEADVAILRRKAPFEQRDAGFEAFFHAGSLEFPADVVEGIRRVAATVPTVVDVYLDRPAILTEFSDDAAALVADFGVSDRALLRGLFGERRPQGKLPFDLPRSMEAVVASRSDVPFDTESPLFRFGHGLTI